VNSNHKTKIWDVSVRIFHWTLTGLISYQLFTSLSENGPSDVHLTIGYCILGLVLFRIFWGFWGSETARFSNFLKSPSSIVDRILRNRSKESTLGHNPLGGYSVLAMILGISVQVISGLFCDDDLMLSGAFSQTTSDGFTSTANLVHAINSKVLLVLICIHVTAIGWYQLIKKQNLIKPMIVGHSTDITLRAGTAQVKERPKRALLLAVFCALIVISLVSFS
jgi:cytochrome b